MHYRPFIELKTQNFYQVMQRKYNISRSGLGEIQLILFKKTAGHRTYFYKYNLKLNLNVQAQIDDYNNAVYTLAGKYNQIKSYRLSIINFIQETKKSPTIFELKQNISAIKKKSSFPLVLVHHFNNTPKGQISFKRKLPTQIHTFCNFSFYPRGYPIEHSVLPINYRARTLASVEFIQKLKLLYGFYHLNYHSRRYPIEYLVLPISYRASILAPSEFIQKSNKRIFRENYLLKVTSEKLLAHLETYVNNYFTAKWLTSRILITPGVHDNPQLPQNRVESASNKLSYLTPAKMELPKTGSTASSLVNKTIGETKVIEAVVPISKQQVQTNSEMDINRLADQVYQLIERKIRIEKERRGM